MAARSLRERMAVTLAVWFGCGLAPKAPGTVGTLGALPVFFILRHHGSLAVAAGAIVLTVVGVWAADIVSNQCGVKDPQHVVIDEVAGVLTALAAAPESAAGVVAAVTLFRIFDHSKPWPARWAERNLPGGYGIVFDDVIAGLWSASFLAMARVAHWL